MRSSCRFRRITPAGAGKTRFTVKLCPTRQDHPRRCGENVSLSAICFLRSGSPPQVRGKPAHTSAARCMHRITPAGAGKTVLLEFAPLRVQDHPRGCGENVFCVSNDGFARGSPPRMRGKLRTGDYSYVAVRITPADAGKTTALRALVSGD